MTIDPGVIIAFITALFGAMTAGARFIYLDLRRDRDFWRQTALQLMAVNSKAIDVAAKPTDG